MEYWIFLVFLTILDLRQLYCLLVTDIIVPEIVDFRENVTLSCSYDMGGHTLNSVKWYKNEMEFFRYSPMMHPVYMKFPVDGIQVSNEKNYCNESTCRVELNLMGKKSSGVYRCEVSGDAPHFKLATKDANMSVAALPQNNPLISSFHSMYRLDELVSANCSSDYSSPPASLMWYINGEKAVPAEVQPRIESTIPAHHYNLRRQISQVQFHLNGPRFFNPGRSLELKCVAEIDNFPELRRETTLNAVLVHDDNLNNQMLVNSGGQALRSLLIIFLLVSILLTISSMALLIPYRCNKNATRSFLRTQLRPPLAMALFYILAFMSVTICSIPQPEGRVS